MICVRCGHKNASGSNYCEKCNAHLAKMGPLKTSSLDVSEGRSYVTPFKSYPTEYMFNLTSRAQEYIYQGASGDPLLEAYKVVRGKVEEFEANAMEDVLADYEAQKLDFPDEDYAHQMTYLINMGIAKFHDSFALMDQFIESGANETLVEAVSLMMYANDYIGFVQELATARREVIREALEKIRAQRRAEELAAKAAATDAADAGGDAAGEDEEKVDSKRQT